MGFFYFIIISIQNEYQTLNIKLSNSQLNKLNSAIKDGTKVTLNLSPNVAGDSNDENNFLHKFY